MPLVRFLAFSRPRDCELGLLLDLTNGRAINTLVRLAGSPAARLRAA
jgi:hypothetical protein